MAAPNIVNVTTITAKTNLANVTTVTANVISNAVGSGQVYKLNDIILSNYGSTVVTANVSLNRNGVGAFFIAGTMSVPGNSTLVVMGKDTAIYMEEGDSLQTSASGNSAVHLVSSYEVIS